MHILLVHYVSASNNQVSIFRRYLGCAPHALSWAFLLLYYSVHEEAAAKSFLWGDIPFRLFWIQNGPWAIISSISPYEDHSCSFFASWEIKQQKCLILKRGHEYKRLKSLFNCQFFQKCSNIFFWYCGRSVHFFKMLKFQDPTQFLSWQTLYSKFSWRSQNSHENALKRRRGIKKWDRSVSLGQIYSYLLHRNQYF